MQRTETPLIVKTENLVSDIQTTTSRIADDTIGTFQNVLNANKGIIITGAVFLIGFYMVMSMTKKKSKKEKE
jgi:hypothetical protein